MIRISAFRATDNPSKTESYIEGHKKILEMYGVTKVTSTDLSWLDNSETIVIHVESENGKSLGGGRLQIANQNFSLPIEEAIGEMDSKIFGLITEFRKEKTAEFCGLWNSKEIAGLGVGSIFLGRVGISLLTQLKLNSLFALCSPATLKPCLNIGFRILEEVGTAGTFYYPKEDLLATALLVPDPETLAHASESDRDRIFSLRKDPIQSAREMGPRGTVEIQYNLHI